MTATLPPLPKLATPADPKLAEKALQMVKTLCRGNGVKTDQVTLKSFSGQMITIAAHTYLEVKPVTREKVVPGKQVIGTMTPGRPGALSAIDQTILNAIKHAGLRRQMIDILLKRADKGFALPESTTLSVDFLTQDFCWHESCRHCSGQGKSPCPRCNGNMREQCNQCMGRTMVPCTLCRGNGTITGQNGKTQPCTRCHGQRQMGCPLCQRTGKITCRQCRGNGYSQCTSCSGSGVFTHTLSLTPQLVTHYEYARADAPLDILHLLDAHANEFMMKGHMKVSANPAQTDPGILAIEYDVTFPYGEIIFMLGKRELKAKLFGFKSRLTNLPNFLEKITAPGFDHLEVAASGQGSVAAQIKKASRYRLIAQALLMAGQNSVRVTADSLMKKFPMGLSKNMAEKIAKTADGAVGNITRKPRYVGLALGLILVTGLYAFYYLGTGRAMLAVPVSLFRFDVLIDLFIILLGGTLTTLCIRMSAANAMRRALGHLVDAKNRRKLIPKAGASAWWGYAGGFFIYLIMVELTRHVDGAVVPAWYQFIFQQVAVIFTGM